jgi:Transposase IS116/IS110/IS902 family
MSDIPTTDPSLLTPIAKLTKDLREAARTLGPAEARFLVDAYYKIQEDRIRSAHQVRTLAAVPDDKVPEPHDTIAWLFTQEQTLENQIRRALDAYSGSHPAGIWARSVVGIGPVIAAGLLAHIDITRAPTVGHIWRYAGLDPTVVWDKGTKRPWNAALKRLCWLIGESFVKVSNNPNDIYGKVYQQRKETETQRNEAGMFAEQAAASLKAKRFGADTQARKHYEAGRLPPARIHLRAERYAVKLFLSHLHHVMYQIEFGEVPARPYVLDHHGGHAHYIAPPNWSGAQP